MDRGSSGEPLSWLVAPAAAILVASALSLPLQPYTGLTLSGDVVVSAVPGAPGIEAGIRPGDRLETSAGPLDAVLGPLARARPGRTLALTRLRGPDRDVIRLTPAPLPQGERAMVSALLVVAAGFLLLGGWVWSERRDRLTRPFHLLCIAFAVVLAVPPRFPWPPATVLHEALYSAATLALPALCVHFFALFPEPSSPNSRLGAGVSVAYGVAGLLIASWAALVGVGVAGGPVPRPVLALLQGAAAIWFAAGLLCALALFARSYARAGSVDARRRLRVALAGAVLGVGPLAALTVIRNLKPEFSIPGERISVLLVLLVPISFTWAIVVHRIFDFRVALRAATAAGVFALLGAAIYVAGELATMLTPGTGTDFGGVALALLGGGAALAGPMRPGMAAMGRVLIPLREQPALTELAIPSPGRQTDPAGMLERACTAVTAALRLDRCLALELDGSGEARVHGALHPGAWSASAAAAIARGVEGAEGPVEAVALPLPGAARELLEAEGIAWVLGIGDTTPRAVLLLGRRLAGPWLDRRDEEALATVARHLGVALENVALRRAARTRGALDRELEAAGAFQSHLLRRAPVYPTLDCAAATWSSEAVGGDCYEFVERSPREFTLVVGDAAGKGVPAALIVAGVQARFRSEALRDTDPGPLLHELNRDLSGRQRPEDFVGLLCARVEVAHGRIHIANAGLMPPLVRRRSGGWEEITAGGLLLGVRADADYPAARVELRAGDVVVIHTDGLAEARRGNELFGLERIRATVDRCVGRRAADILEGLLRDVRSFADPPLDDLTVVVMKQLADPPRRPSRTGSSPRTNGPMPSGETTEAVSPVRAANPRAADPNG